jgi:hypothetical protein
MPRNGSGTYTLPALNPVIPFTTITTLWANSTLDDIALALTGSIAANGVTPITGNLQMNGFRHTGVGPATTYNQYARADQVQENQFSTLTAVTAVSDAVTTQYRGNLVLGQPNGGRPFIAGQMISFVPNITNTGSTSTSLKINGGTVNIIFSSTGTNLAAGSIHAGQQTVLVFNGSDWQLVGGVSDASQIIAALGYTPLKNTTDTLTGNLTVTNDISATGDLFVDDANVSGNLFVIGNASIFSGTTVSVQGELIVGRLTFLATGLAGSGAANVDMQGRQVLGCLQTGNLTLTVSNNVNDGELVKILFSGTNAGVVTWPAEVVWGSNNAFAAPNLAAGPFKQAIVTFVVSGAFVLGDAVMY